MVPQVQGGTAMLRCILCAFETELDDAVVVSTSGRCICLRCFARATNTQKRMSTRLRREVAAALDPEP
jgi:hypothetical protein